MRGLTILFLCVLLCFGCEKPFRYSPYERIVSESYSGTTKKNLEQLASYGDVSKPFRIALLSDTHYHFDDLADAVTKINQRSDVLFVVVTGDIAESGLLVEYELFHDAMSRLEKPYLTVIGNHDYLSDGGAIYQEMFGEYNYSTVFGNVKLIFFDNVSWESDKTPDMQWLARELADSTVQQKITFSHIPPFDPQFIPYRHDFHDLIKRAGLKLSIHGHKHEFTKHDLYYDGVDYVTVGAPDKRSYCELIVDADSITIEKIEF